MKRKDGEKEAERKQEGANDREEGNLKNNNASALGNGWISRQLASPDKLIAIDVFKKQFKLSSILYAQATAET